MKKLILLSLFALAIGLLAMVAQAEDQKPGQELVFPNVEQVRQRPSDVHVGSDPYYQPGMEQPMEGTDKQGYKKKKVETDKEYREESPTTYKRVDGKSSEGDLAPGR